MSITNDRKQTLITEYKRNDKDTGSPEVQVAIMTERITALTNHLRSNRHDYSSQRGLLQLVSKRTSLLKYLARTDRSRYQELIGRLGLRK